MTSVESFLRVYQFLLSQWSAEPTAEFICHFVLIQQYPWSHGLPLLFEDAARKPKGDIVCLAWQEIKWDDQEVGKDLEGKPVCLH